MLTLLRTLYQNDEKIAAMTFMQYINFMNHRFIGPINMCYFNSTNA